MNWITEQTNSVYGQAPKLKMCRKKFSKHVKNSFLVGMIQSAESVEKLIRDNSDMTHAELRGEIHKLILDYTTESRKNNGSTWRRPTMARVTDLSTKRG